jgi:Domain of unknown function (DU1801)
MKTDERLGTFEGILDGHVAEVARIARALRRLIASVHDGATETPRMGERCTTYGLGPRKMTEAYAHIMPLKDAVNLGLYHGVALPDPSGLLEGTGKRARHVKVRNVGEAKKTEVRALIAAAVAERAAALKAR